MGGLANERHKHITPSDQNALRIAGLVLAGVKVATKLPAWCASFLPAVRQVADGGN